MSILTNVKRYILLLILQNRRKNVRIMFNNYFQRILKLNPAFNINDDNHIEDRWIAKWRVFGMEPNKNIYRFYKFYIGDNVDIVPNDIARNFIEPVLTPEAYQPFYNDKNSFALFLDKSMMPKTYVHAMNNLLYDEDYNVISAGDIFSKLKDAQKIIIKPTKEMGGKGITLFTRVGSKFIDNFNNDLTYDYLLKNYVSDYIIQECLIQHEFMSQFNPTSVNTLRIAVMRDIESGKLSIMGGFLRIGGKGAVVDNISSGGSSVPIDTNNGKLGKFASDISRVKHSSYNGINFLESDFIVPNWDKVQDFVYKVASRMPHMNLFANDIAIDLEGNPKLIEVNTTDFSYTFYQVSGKPFFGQYTDKVISYCLNQNKRYKPEITYRKVIKS